MKRFEKVVSSGEVSVLRHEGGYGGGGNPPLIGQEFKMVDRKQPSNWTIIQDGRLACDWTRIQDGGQKSNHLIGQ